MICEHLIELESAIKAAGIKETFRGAAWSNKLPRMGHFDCVLVVEAIRRAYDLADCVKDHAHYGTHDGQEAGLVCEMHKDASMAECRTARRGRESGSRVS